MSNTNDLLNRINAKYSTMSKGHKLLATYITDNYDKAVFLTAAKMGETVGISESTVVRYIARIQGISRFSEGTRGACKEQAQFGSAHGGHIWAYQPVTDS